MSFKLLFSRAFAGDPERLHFAAHSHHLWPDASFAGHMQAWDDAARLADRKWDKVMGEVWSEAQAHVARELGSGDPDSVVFSSNTHDFLVRLVTAAPRRSACLRVLTSDGEFHSARRQLARWEEEGRSFAVGVFYSGTLRCARRKIPNIAINSHDAGRRVTSALHGLKQNSP